MSLYPGDDGLPFSKKKKPEKIEPKKKGRAMDLFNKATTDKKDQKKG